MNQLQNNKNINQNSFEFDFYETLDTYVHPSSIVGPDVKLGENVKIGPNCLISGKVKIKSGTRIYSGVVIGSPAQNVGTQKSLGYLEIGNNCEIREYTTIGASKYPDGKTIIGNNCYIMSYCHIAHDAIIEDNVIMINSVNLGGHVHVEHNAVLMANSAAHQFCRIGKYTSLAPFSAIRQDLPPFCMFSGLPAKFEGLNRIGLKRAGFSSDDINFIKHVAKLTYQDKLLLEDIEKLAENEPWGQNKSVQEFIFFMKNSQRGVSRK